MAKKKKAEKANKNKTWTNYTLSGDKADRKNPFCPKCGTGVMLALHKDRQSCGKCGYTDFKKKE